MKTDADVLRRLRYSTGAKLREARQTRRMTQQELADKAQVSRPLIGRYECGGILPPIDVLYRLADVLECGAQELLPVAA